jgi:DNA-binding XRE family transcriptional regulator
MKAKCGLRRWTTVLTLDTFLGTIDLRIVSHLSARQRRQIALTFFRQIRPWLQYLRSGAIYHLGDSPDFRRAEERGIQLKTALDITTPKGLEAFRLRMRRLERRWTQAELAERVQMSRRQLSRIERGLHRPSARVARNLEYALRSGKLDSSPFAKLRLVPTGEDPECERPEFNPDVSCRFSRRGTGKNFSGSEA